LFTEGKSHELSQKNTGFPALFSFFIPGLVQLVKGQLFKAGIRHLDILIISGTTFIFGTGIPLGLIIWIWQIFNAIIPE